MMNAPIKPRQSLPKDAVWIVQGRRIRPATVTMSYYGTAPLADVCYLDDGSTARVYSAQIYGSQHLARENVNAWLARKGGR